MQDFVKVLFALSIVHVVIYTLLYGLCFAIYQKIEEGGHRAPKLKFSYCAIFWFATFFVCLFKYFFS